MWLLADFTPRWPWFDSKTGHVGFVVDRVVLGLFFSESAILILPIASHNRYCIVSILAASLNNHTKLNSVSELYRPSDRRLLAK
jgi:hypothetical protein